MRRYRAMALAALLCTAAAPAFAAWDHVGSVDVSVRDDHGTVWTHFRGDSVALTSRDGSVDCHNVSATSDSGRSRTIFRGYIQAGQTVNVDLHDLRDVQRLDFDCRPMDNWRARVDVAANMFDRDMYGQRYGYERPYDRPYGDQYSYNYGSHYDNPVDSFFGHLMGR